MYIKSTSNSSSSGAFSFAGDPQILIEGAQFLPFGLNINEMGSRQHEHIRNLDRNLEGSSRLSGLGLPLSEVFTRGGSRYWNLTGPAAMDAWAGRQRRPAGRYCRPGVS